LFATPTVAIEDGKSDILVAVAGPMTGRYATFGSRMRSSAVRATHVINAKGGISGRSIQVIVEDDACNRDEAIAAAKRLVARKVAVVIGHLCPSASIAAAPIYAAASIVMISPGTTEPVLTDKRAGPTIFRLAPRSDSESPMIGRYLARAFAGKRIAILHDRTVVGTQLAAGVKKAMNADGIAEVLYSGFIAGEKDYTALARDMRTQRIDAVFLGAYPTEAVLILTALRQQQLTTVVVGSMLLGTNDFLQPAKPYLNNMVVQPGADFLDDLDVNTDRMDPHTRAYVGNGTAVLTRAAVMAWAEAAKSANDNLSTAVAARLHSGRFKTWAGEFGFDNKGDATLQFYKMFIWKDGDNAAPAP
jgi:branched-chain amino acid transport system substrate-binding protein